MTYTTEQIVDMINLYNSSAKVQLKLSESSIKAIAEDADGDYEKAKATIDGMVFTRNLAF